MIGSGAVVPYPADVAGKTVHQIVEDFASTQPDAIAVTDGDEHMTCVAVAWQCCMALRRGLGEPKSMP